MNLQLAPKYRALILVAIQAVIVLSVAGKYLYDRQTYPRIWVPTAQYDPSMPLRGRYLALNLTLDACGLPHDEEHQLSHADNPPYEWRVYVGIGNGKLFPMLSEESANPRFVQRLTQGINGRCDRAVLREPVDYYIPDTAQPPFPLKTGQELWVEVTVPPSGPPRPIQLALSQNGAWTPLKLE